MLGRSALVGQRSSVVRSSSRYDIVSGVYDLVMGGVYGHYARCARIALDLLGPLQDVSVLDVGGGTGGVAALLAAAGARAQVLDRSHALARQARRRALATTTGDAAHLPYGDGVADVVVLCEALHHVADPAAALAAVREVHRVLRSAGRLLIFEIDPPSTPAGRVHLWLERLLFGPIRCWPRHQLLEALARHGFAVSCPAHPEVTEGYVVLAVKRGAEGAEGAEETWSSDQGLISGGGVAGGSPVGEQPLTPTLSQG